jgi:hypothetical protein
MQLGPTIQNRTELRVLLFGGGLIYGATTK